MISIEALKNIIDSETAELEKLENAVKQGKNVSPDLAHLCNRTLAVLEQTMGQYKRSLIRQSNSLPIQTTMKWE